MVNGNDKFFFCLAVMALMLCVPVSSARAACSNPAGDEGEQIYNADHKTMQFCDGTDWISMSGGGSSGGSVSGTIVGGGFHALPVGGFPGSGSCNAGDLWGNAYCSGKILLCGAGSTKRVNYEPDDNSSILHYFCIQD